MDFTFLTLLLQPLCMAVENECSGYAEPERADESANTGTLIFFCKIKTFYFFNYFQATKTDKKEVLLAY